MLAVTGKWHITKFESCSHRSKLSIMMISSCSEIFPVCSWDISRIPYMLRRRKITFFHPFLPHGLYSMDMSVVNLWINVSSCTTNTWGNTYSTTHQRLVEVQFGRYQKNILQEWSMVINLSCVSCAAWNVFPHKFNIDKSRGCRSLFAKQKMTEL